MSPMSRIFSAILLATAVLVVCADNVDKHWPNFSCHPVNQSSSELQRRAVNMNRMGWKSCQEPYKKWNGRCPQICVLNDDQVIYKKSKEGPVVFDTKKFITHYAKELGYTLDGPDGKEKELMNKIGSKVDGCKLSNPEYKNLTDLRNTKCEPWDNFLKCIETAVGCGGLG